MGTVTEVNPTIAGDAEGFKTVVSSEITTNNAGGDITAEEEESGD